MMTIMHYPIPPRFLEEVDAIIMEHLEDESFNVEVLSDELHLSKSQVYRKIKYQTGQSTSEYIRVKRLICAKRLIEQSDMQLSEIAYSVGFSCLSYFSRSFAAYYGCPPSHMR